MTVYKRLISKLSQLEIDVDKDWQVKGISNLEELAASMTKGDMLLRGDSILVLIQPGNNGDHLTSNGPGNLPTWQS